MYHPYFRGKQYELITVRESVDVLAKSGFIPIIEPVRESLGGLEKALQAICDANGKAIVVVNPNCGHLCGDGEKISQLLKDRYFYEGDISAGILLRSDMNIENAVSIYDEHIDFNPTVIHSGFTRPKDFANHIDVSRKSSQHAFIDDHAKTLYRKHFNGCSRILIHDGFNRKRNADYDYIEEFSDLHVTYSELGMSGFGDFLIVGNNYSESGGPAYAVAIHITFIDDANDDMMYVYHFVSDTKDTPADPAGKFGQALNKMIMTLESGSSKILETSAITEFRELHRKSHFPGLGYVKKLSMRHHIETLADYMG